MKKFIVGFITGIFLLTPALAFSAPSLAARLKGRILLAVEDMGKTYYVASDGYRYQVTRATAQKVFEKLALGISNKNLEQIPVKAVAIEPEPEVVSPAPQVAGDTVQVIEKVVDRIVYVDKPAQCDSQYDSTFYINQIERLKQEITDLQEKNQSLSNQISVPNSKVETSNRLKKEYGLRLNALQKQLLNAQYRLNHIEAVITDAEGPSWRNISPQGKIDSYKRSLNSEIETITRNIALSQNELEKKLLELE